MQWAGVSNFIKLFSSQAIQTLNFLFWCLHYCIPPMRMICSLLIYYHHGNLTQSMLNGWSLHRLFMLAIRFLYFFIVFCCCCCTQLRRRLRWFYIVFGLVSFDYGYGSRNMGLFIPVCFFILCSLDLRHWINNRFYIVVVNLNINHWNSEK